MRGRRHVRCVVAFMTLLISPLARVTAISVDVVQKPEATRVRLAAGEIAKKVSASVVTIIGKTSQGSGVIVDPSGLVLTNLHVIRGQSQISVKLQNGDIYDDVSVVDADARKDIAVIRIKAFNVAVSALGNSDGVSVGDHVVVIGSPQGLEQTVSDGLISAIRDSGDGYRLFQTNAAVSPGSSGGGIFNQEGDLVGIVAAQLPGGQNLNFGIPINYARGLLETKTSMTLAEFDQQFPDNSAAPSNQPATNATSNASSTPSSEDQAKLDALIQASGFTAKEKTASGAWQITFKGDQSASVTVLVSVFYLGRK